MLDDEIVFVPLRGISLYIRIEGKDYTVILEFSSPYEELVYISKQ